MEKYYRLKKDSFLWKEGAIIKLVDPLLNGSKGYQPISDIWDTTEHNQGEYITTKIIENNPEWFERVYKSKTDKFINKALAMLEFGKVVTE